MTHSLAWMLLNQSQSHVQHDDASHQPLDLSHSPLREYHVTLSSGETIYILAQDTEEAAWLALELAADRDLYLVDVAPTDEK